MLTAPALFNEFKSGSLVRGEVLWEGRKDVRENDFLPSTNEIDGSISLFCELDSDGAFRVVEAYLGNVSTADDFKVRSSKDFAGQVCSPREIRSQRSWSLRWQESRSTTHSVETRRPRGSMYVAVRVTPIVPSQAIQLDPMKPV